MRDEAERLYERARALPRDARAAFVEETCRDDPPLRDELASLLEHADAAEEFFELLSGAVRAPLAALDGEDARNGSAHGSASARRADSSASDRMVGRTIGRYRILSHLGRGGMGTVYRARDTRLDRAVALKFLPPHLDVEADAEARLLVEARAAAGLEHPNVCTIHEIGETDDGRPFIAMALYDGETLRERLRHGPLPPAEAVAVAVQIARGLAAAHARGIVHRDVKPGNVVLTSDGTVKLLDFGLAKVADASLTRPGVTPGTIAYMSPEQARGDPVDHRTDLWSLGVVLYEMLAGTRPFRGGGDRALLQAILHAEPEPISTHRAETPEWLEPIIRHLLRKTPADRFGSAADLVAALTTADVPAETGWRAATAKRARHGTRRRAPLVALVGLVAIATIATAVVAFVLGARSHGGPSVERFGRATRVTSDPGLEIQPAISPDGRFVAYAAGTPASTRIFVRQVAGGRPIAVADDTADLQAAPSWSPDGTRILFLTQGRVFSVPSGGGPARPEIPAMRDTVVTWAAWAPDGATIAFATPTTLQVRAPGGTPRRVAELDDPGPCSWAPDGRLIACASGNAAYQQVGLRFGNLSPSRIVVVRVGDGAVVTVADGRSLNQSPTWSRDGRWLYFVSARDGAHDVYALEIARDGTASGTPFRLTTGLGAQAISLSADGARLAYNVLSATANVWSLPMPAAPPVTAEDAAPVTSGNQVIEGASVSTDGQWLFFDSDVGGSADLYRLRLPGGEPERLTTDPSDDFNPVPSPDGREVAFHSWRSGSRDVYVMPLDGGPVQRVTSSPEQEAGAAWSPDGRALLYGELASTGGIWIVRRHADGTWDTPVRRLGFGFSKAWSPDGRLIAVTDGLPGGSLFVVPADRGAPRLVVDASRPDRPSAALPVWSADGRTIYFKSHDASGRASIWGVPTAGGTPRPIVRFDDPMRPSYRPTLALSHGTLYFTVDDRQSDVWVVELVPR